MFLRELTGKSTLTPALTKNTNIEVLKLEQVLQKNEVVTGKTPLFVIGPFCSSHSICLIRWPISVTAKPKSHGKTKKPRQNKRSWQSKNHGNAKQQQQNEKFRAK